MSKSEDIVEKDRQVFEDILERKKKINDYFGDLLKTEEIVSIYNNLFRIKRELNEFFKKNLGDVCNACNGNCCKRYVFEVVGNECFLMWNFFNFELPTPNFAYLAQKELKNGFSSCVFLNETGCSLGVYKPFYCYSYIAPTDCDPGMKILGGRNFSIAEKLIEEYRKFSF
jgi:hypothetical protein